MKCRQIVVPLMVVLLAAACLGVAPEVNADDAGVRQFIEHYFSTWSARDIEAYDMCFHILGRLSYLAGDV